MSITRYLRCFVLLWIVNATTTIGMAEAFPIEQLQESNPTMAQFFSGCLSINQYLRSNDVECLEDALYEMNPNHIEVEIFEPDSIGDASGLCDSIGSYFYDYEYASAIYEDREIPKELDLQRGTSECKVALLMLKPLSSIVYSIFTFDKIELITICEPDHEVSLSIKESETGNTHIGESYEDNTVCHASWTMDEGVIEITISNLSDEFTTLAFLSN